MDAMKWPVFTTEVRLDFDADAFGREYEVFAIDTDDKYIPGGARVLDIPEEYPFVLAAVFDKRTLYVMCRRSACAGKTLNAAVEKAGKGSLRCKDASCPFDIPRAAVAKLLLAASGNGARTSSTFQNVSGRLLRCHRREDDGQGVVVLETRIAGDDKLVLSVSVRTFTPLSLRDSMEYWSKEDKKYVPVDDGYIARVGKFAIDGSGVLRRILPSEKVSARDAYIQKKPRWEKHSRNTVAFLDRTSAEDFEATKAGIVLDIVDGFNRRYGGKDGVQARLSFSRIDDVRVWTRDEDGGISSASAAAEAAYLDGAAAFLERMPLRVVDTVGSEESAEAAERLASAFEALMRREDDKKKKQQRFPFKADIPCVVRAKAAAEPEDGFFDMRIVPSVKSLKEGVVDPYTHNLLLAQHVTVESLRRKKSVPHVAEKMLAEAVVKADVAQGRISAFDWTSLGLEEPAFFAAPDWTGGDDKAVCALVVDPAGKIRYVPADDAMFEAGDVMELCGALAGQKTERGAWTAEAMMRIGGATGMISDSGLSAMPDVARLRDKLEGARNRGVSFDQAKRAFAVAARRLGRADAPILDEVLHGLFSGGVSTTTERVSAAVVAAFKRAKKKADEEGFGEAPSGERKAKKAVDEAFRETAGFGIGAYAAGGDFGMKGPVYAAIRGIWSYERGGEYYFCAGPVVEGDSVDESYPTAPRIRKLKVLEGDGERLMELVARMLDVRFVRLGRTTVLPFPFKYLRECSAARRSWEKDDTAS